MHVDLDLMAPVDRTAPSAIMVQCSMDFGLSHAEWPVRLGHANPNQSAAALKIFIAPTKAN